MINYPDKDFAACLIIMPNIEKEDLYMIDSYGEKQFDFEKLIPMPKDFSNTINNGIEDPGFVWYMTYHGMDKLTSEMIERLDSMCYHEPDEKITKKAKRDRWTRALRLAKDAIDDGVTTDVALYAFGKMSYTNFSTYGARDWYEWRMNNWGTIYNAMNTLIDEDMVMFCVEKTIPHAVFQALSEKYPDTEIIISWENCVYNGTFIQLWQNGKASDIHTEWLPPKNQDEAFASVI